MYTLEVISCRHLIVDKRIFYAANFFVLVTFIQTYMRRVFVEVYRRLKTRIDLLHITALSVPRSKHTIPQL